LLLPVAEIFILVEIGKATAAWVPFAIIAASMLAGFMVARHQGLRVLQRTREDIARGQMPADSLFDAFLILIAGMLLIFPGVLTDILGIALLVSPSRALIKRGLKAWVRRHVEIRIAQFGAPFQQDGARGASAGQDQIVDARVINTRVEDASRPGG
ncbi:MAG TPA: FxsA family protein, partial [Lacipirellulaceae bacterium]|nr:FxsA family protein [Lacipirellulaceae bacterium]